jgi:hypothetical protein
MLAKFFNVSEKQFSHFPTMFEGADYYQKEFAGFIAGFFNRCSPLVRISRGR